MYQPDKLNELVKDRCAGPKPFTLESLIAWLRTKPADGIYCYVDWKECLLGLYTLENGGKFTSPLAGDYQIGDVIYPALGSDLAIGVARPHPKTFGAALSRALALQSNGGAQ